MSALITQAYLSKYMYLGPASVAHLDVYLIDDLAVTGSTPMGLAIFFPFSTVILSLLLIQEGQLSVSGERMCTMLANH